MSEFKFMPHDQRPQGVTDEQWAEIKAQVAAAIGSPTWPTMSQQVASHKAYNEDPRLVAALETWRAEFKTRIVPLLNRAHEETEAQRKAEEEQKKWEDIGF